MKRRRILDAIRYPNGFASLVDEQPVFAMSQQGGVAEIQIYEEIGFDFWTGSGITAKGFSDELKALGDVNTINVLMNSPGGDVFEAVAIYNILMNHPAKVNVRIDALAASAASIIAMVGDKISIAANAQMMIHNVWTFAMGNADELRKVAETLDTIGQGLVTTYSARSGKDAKTITAMLDAETWMTGQQAVDEGFADEVLPAKTGVSGKFAMLAKYKNAPAELLQPKTTPFPESFSAIETMRLRLDLKEKVF